MSKAKFNQLMPSEFWQEVVDRISNEVPDTLLLAEAFWMMEGYFVRTLGMHRVYNSAFMHMLRDEDNQKYRELITKTLEYDPQILKRYVNFMNNPDEDTAISQFGSDGKYFGICLLMATLPGLPMFGHGQIEGYSEKYGMEYQRAYYNEEANIGLINRHEREIFPLLKLRYVFADVDHFCLYDVVSSSGSVIQDVFAFSNRKDSTAVLVIYHNKWSEIEGSIHKTTPINKSSVPLLDALGLDYQGADYLLFRDHISGKEYIRSIPDLRANGLQLRLGAYHYQVFMDFTLVTSSDNTYRKLHENLQGAGIDNLQERLQEIKYEPVLVSTTNLLEEVLDQLMLIKENSNEGPPPTYDGNQTFISSIYQCLEAIWAVFPGTRHILAKESIEDFDKKLISLSFLRIYDFPYVTEYLYCLTTTLFLMEFQSGISKKELGLIYDLVLKHSRYKKFFFYYSEQYPDFYLLQDLIKFTSMEYITAKLIAETWFSNPISRDFLGVHNFEGLSWFNKESFEVCLELTLIAYMINNLPVKNIKKKKMLELKKNSDMFKELFLIKLANSNYQVDEFLSYF
jgi:hypothetical protein